MAQSKHVVINLPGKFDDFLGGSSEISGDNGRTPLYVAYKEHSRHTKRGKGYTREITFAFDDVEMVREALTELYEQASNCVYFNQDVMYDEQTQAEVKAAKLVIERVDALLKTLPAPKPEQEPELIATEPVAPPVVQIRHRSATDIINGFTPAQHARLLLWFKDVSDDMVSEHPDIRFEDNIATMREIIRRDWDRVL